MLILSDQPQRTCFKEYIIYFFYVLKNIVLTNFNCNCNADDDILESPASSITAESEEEEAANHHLLTAPNIDGAFLKEKPVRRTKEVM